MEKMYIVSDIGGEDSLLKLVYATDELDVMRQTPGYKIACVYNKPGMPSVIEVIADTDPAKG